MRTITIVSITEGVNISISHMQVSDQGQAPFRARVQDRSVNGTLLAVDEGIEKKEYSCSLINLTEDAKEDLKAVSDDMTALTITILDYQAETADTFTGICQISNVTFNQFTDLFTATMKLQET